MLASFCFLMLAVYGWGMTWEKLGSFLLVLFVLLGGLIAIAAFLGWMLRKLKSRGKTTATSFDGMDELNVDNKAEEKEK